MAGLRPVARTLAAIGVATFLAGALVNVRLRAATALPMDPSAIVGQGLEVAALFLLLVVPAAVAAWLLARRLHRGSRPLLGVLTYAFAFALLLMVYGRADLLDVALDGYAHLYLASGALAVAVAAPPAKASGAPAPSPASPA